MNDYRIANESREASLLGRKEVLSGKAKFGIFGDGKEIAQVAMAKFFQPGDFRAGYYRDQTFMFAAGIITIEQFFAQLYANPDIEAEPSSGGRQMNAHFATPFVDDNGNWLNLTERKNISADIAPTSGQMPRALGLAFASEPSLDPASTGRAVAAIKSALQIHRFDLSMIESLLLYRERSSDVVISLTVFAWER